MAIFLSLLTKLAPLYILLFLGFLAGKYHAVQKESIAKMLVYFLLPAVVYLGVYKAEIKNTFFLLPLVFYIIVCSIALMAFFIGKFLWKDSTRTLFAYASAAGNIGYLGLPLCLMLFGEQALPIAATLILGLSLFESTLGYYLFARSKSDFKSALLKLLKLPVLYAFIIGVIVNKFALSSPQALIEVFNLLKGGYSAFGMMIIGLGLAGISQKDFDGKFILLSMLNKFGLWFLIAYSLIWLDQNYLHLFNEITYKVFLVESIVPIAGNTVSYASIFKTKPAKASIAVLLSTLVALIFIPLILIFMDMAS